MMFKRNGGYALSYVLVVLMVLAIIATAVMAPPLRNLQMQQASIERMQDKYTAQGMIEQVVAQLEKSGNAPTTSENDNPTVAFESETNTYTINAKSENHIIEAKVKVTTESTNSECSIYTVNYESYNISYHTQEVQDES